MLKYDTRRVEMEPNQFSSRPYLENNKIHSLYHLSLYLAHVTYAI